jgi:hypothetical protein
MSRERLRATVSTVGLGRGVTGCYPFIVGHRPFVRSCLKTILYTIESVYIRRQQKVVVQKAKTRCPSRAAGFRCERC